MVTQNCQNCTEVRQLQRYVSGLFTKANRVNNAKELPNYTWGFLVCIFSCLCWSSVAPVSSLPWYILAFQLLFDLFQSWLKISPYRTSQWDAFSSAPCSISADPLFFCPLPADQLLLLNHFFRNPGEISSCAFCLHWEQDQRLKIALSPEVCGPPHPSLCFGISYGFGLYLFRFASRRGHTLTQHNTNPFH